MLDKFHPKNVASHFDKEAKFFKSWIDKPKTMGAILPTSSFTANKMASLIKTDNTSPILELGPGTGVITKAILDRGVEPKNLFSIEYNDEFIDGLNEEFPDVNILHGDAFELEELLKPYNLEKFGCVISAVPMLNFSNEGRIILLNKLFNLLEPNAPVVQISYGPVSPISPDWETFTVEPLKWVMKNVPPARLWVYRRLSNS